MDWDFSTSRTSGNDKNDKKVNFTKFPVGITRIRIVDEAPHIRWAHWFAPAGRYFRCPGKGCPVCAIRQEQKKRKQTPTHNITRRFAITVFNQEKEQVEVLEQGLGFFEEVRDLREELAGKGKSLFDTDLQVKRRGTTKDDTSYRIDIGETSALSDKHLKLIESKKIDFEEYYKAPTNEQIERLLRGDKWEDVFKRVEEESQAIVEVPFDLEEEIELK